MRRRAPNPHALHPADIGRDDRAFPVRGSRCIKDGGGLLSVVPVHPEANPIECTDNEERGLAPLPEEAGAAPSVSTRPIDWYAHVQPAPFVPYLALRKVHSPWSYYGLIEVDAGRV